MIVRSFLVLVDSVTHAMQGRKTATKMTMTTRTKNTFGIWTNLSKGKYFDHDIRSDVENSVVSCQLLK